MVLPTVTDRYGPRICSKFSFSCSFDFENHGKGGNGYKSEKGTGTFETLYSKDAPEGDAYLKWSPGQLDDKLVQHLVVGDDFDPEPGFQIDARSWLPSQSGAKSEV